MKGSTLPGLLFLVFALAYSAVSVADATLVGIESSRRVPGSFLVIFKSAWDLEAAPRTGLGAPTVLPDLLPVSEYSTRMLAEALCNHIHARVRNVSYWPPYAAFWVEGAQDVAVREFLAKDPRIAEIEANFYVSDQF